MSNSPAPYAVIEGVYVVADSSPVSSPTEVDQMGHRVGVKEGSAYDLFLSRNLQRAELVRGVEGTTVIADQGLEMGAGIRQPVLDFVAANPGFRVLEPAFMEIQQAVGTTRARRPETIAFLRGFRRRAEVRRVHRRCPRTVRSRARQGRPRRDASGAPSAIEV